jgi:hypothetical protein
MTEFISRYSILDNDSNTLLACSHLLRHFLRHSSAATLRGESLRPIDLLKDDTYTQYPPFIADGNLDSSESLFFSFDGVAFDDLIGWVALSLYCDQNSKEAAPLSLFSERMVVRFQFFSSTDNGLSSSSHTSMQSLKFLADIADDKGGVPGLSRCLLLNEGQDANFESSGFAIYCRKIQDLWKIVTRASPGDCLDSTSNSLNKLGSVIEGKDILKICESSPLLSKRVVVEQAGGGIAIATTHSRHLLPFFRDIAEIAINLM